MVIKKVNGGNFQLEITIKNNEKAVAQNLISYLQNLKNLLAEPSQCLPKNFRNFSKFANLKNPSADGSEILKCFNGTTNASQPEMSPEDVAKMQNDLNEIKKSEKDMKKKIVASIYNDLANNTDRVILQKPTPGWKASIIKDFNPSLSKILDENKPEKSLVEKITSARQIAGEHADKIDESIKQDSNCADESGLAKLQSEFDESEKSLKKIPPIKEIHDQWKLKDPINATLAKQMNQHWDNSRLKHQIIKAKVCAAMSKSREGLKESKKKIDKLSENVKQLVDKKIKDSLGEMTDGALDVKHTLKTEKILHLLTEVINDFADKVKNLSSQQNDIEGQLKKSNPSNASQKPKI